MNYSALNASTLDGTSNTTEDATLLGGVVSASFAVFGALALSAVLFTSVHASSNATVSANIFTTPALTGGSNESSSLNAGYVISALQKGGVYSTMSAYENVAALATGGTTSNTSLGGYITALLSGGVLTTQSFYSATNISFTAPSMRSTQLVDGRLYIPITLSFGVKSGCLVDGDMYWRPGQYDDVESTDTFGGIQKKDAVLSTGVITSQYFSADLLEEPTLTPQFFTGGVDSTLSVGGSLSTVIYTKTGISSYQGFSGNLILSAKEAEGVACTSIVYSTPIRVIPPAILTGGISSTWSTTDVDISSYYGDMLHDAWQLGIASATLTREIADATLTSEIASVTLTLEINTPIGDS